jgi:hypothetical protein
LQAFGADTGEEAKALSDRLAIGCLGASCSKQFSGIDRASLYTFCPDARPSRHGAARGPGGSPGRPSAIPHINARFFIRRLKSGRLLLVRHDPPAGSTKRSHLKGFLSGDDGKTWSAGLLLDEHVGVSYPDGVQAPNGTIHLIYDFDRNGARQILTATLTEADILARKPVAIRTVVNQAGKAPE